MFKQKDSQRTLKKEESTSNEAGASKKVIEIEGKTGKHSYSEEETVAFTEHINNLLKDDEDLKEVLPIQPEGLFDVVGDGIVLNKLINTSKEGTVDERVINKGKKGKKLNDWERAENLSLAINSAAGIGCSTINVGPNDLAHGNHTIILGLLWQVIRVGLLADINLKAHPELVVLLQEGETLEELIKKNPEELLRRWFNYQLKKAGSERQVKNFTSDITDSECYTLVLNQISQQKTNLSPLQEEDKMKRAALMLEEADKISCKKFVDPKTVCSGNSKLNLAFVANMFNNYPNMDPLDGDTAASLMDFDDEGTREERAFRFWIQSMGLEVNNLFDDLRDGCNLLKIEDKVQPGCVGDISKIQPPKNQYQVMENCNKAVKVAKDNLKLVVVNIGGEDVAKGAKKQILALTWQLMRLNLINVLKALSEDGKDIQDQDIVNWANEKLKDAGMSIESFKDKTLGTGVFLCELCAAVKPTAVNKDFITPGETKEDAEKNAKYAISVARKLNAPVFLLWEDIVEVKPKMIMTFVGALMKIDRQLNGKK